MIEVNGRRVEITNWDEFKHKLLSGIGVQLENEVLDEISRMRLVDKGQLRRISHEVKNDELTLWSDAPYAVFIEFGTFAYWDRYGVDSFPVPGYPSIPKKKELGSEARTKLPKGMQPFAPFRRVMYNQNKMSKVINRAVRSASK